MISDERTVTYINSLDEGNTPFLDEVEEQALRDGVPIIRKDMQGFLRFMMRICKPRKILEVGTATGFSALLMAQYAPDASITTIEKYEKRIPVAIDNFKRSGMGERITLLEGDATKILAGLDESYDLIFMDAAKGQYLHFLPDVERLLVTGGVLITDNILQEGDILESRYAVCRRNRTIHARMREYLYTLKHSPVWETQILTLGDGVSVSFKKETNDEKA